MTSKPAWSNTSGCSTTPVFLFASATGEDAMKDEPEWIKSYWTDESQHKGDGHSQTDEPPDEPLAPMTIDTADPVIDTAVEHPSDWKLHPDATIRVETTRVASRTSPAFRESGRSSPVKKPGDSQDARRVRTAEVTIEAVKQDADRGR